MEGISELARLFKERDNKPYLGPQLGKVINPLPELKVSLGEKIILTKEQLIVAAHVLNSYERDFEVDGERLEFEQLTAGETGKTALTGEVSPETHSHVIDKIKIEAQYKSIGKIKLTDTLKAGDQVMLIPTTDEQKYFLIDKVVNI